LYFNWRRNWALYVCSAVLGYALGARQADAQTVTKNLAYSCATAAAEGKAGGTSCPLERYDYGDTALLVASCTGCNYYKNTKWTRWANVKDTDFVYACVTTKAPGPWFSCANAPLLLKTQITLSGATPPPPACTHPARPAESQTVQCAAPTTGSWTQTRACTESACPVAGGPTTWTCGAWSPATEPAGACAVPPPPNPTITSLTATPTSGVVPFDVSVRWTSANAETCVLSEVAGSVPLSGLLILRSPPLYKNSWKISLICGRPDWWDQKSVDVVLLPPPPPPPWQPQCSPLHATGGYIGDVPEAQLALGVRWKKIGVWDCTIAGGTRQVHSYFFDWVKAEPKVTGNPTNDALPWDSVALNATEDAYAKTVRAAWLAAHP
jgi:hypothetical protein